ncbi:hypothetical protein D9757_007834 [Collybiopsis confluens]|uniref:Uncharacterized protein n=1 Tax=Collybiopsis confluens TaxID=2823264 RepID=A0A8H5HQ75_9AGAR|nr:hypothetical protein D9757_007834 [Collybiopsis confluens]
MANARQRRPVNELLDRLNDGLAVPSWKHDTILNNFAQHWFELGPTAEPNKEERLCYTLVTQLPTSTNDLQDFGLYSSNGRILVTKGLSDLFARLELGFSLKTAGSQTTGTMPKNGSMGVLLTGQPGIGKSVSLWYLTIRLLAKHKFEPVFVFRPQRQLLFWEGYAFEFKNSGHAMIGRAFTDALTNFARGNSVKYPDQRCFALHESLPGNQEPPVLGCTIPIYASSPGGAKLRLFKTKYRPYIWGLPTWSKEELWRGLWLDRNVEYAMERITEREVLDIPKRRCPFNPYYDKYDDDVGGSDLDLMSDDSGYNGSDNATVAEEEEEGQYNLSPTFNLSNPDNEGIDIKSLLVMYRYLELAIRTMGWTAREAVDQMKPTDILEYLSKLTNLDWFTAYAAGPQNTTGDRVSFPHTIFYQHLQPAAVDSLDDAMWIIAFKSPIAEDVFTEQLTGKPWRGLHGLLDAMSRSKSPSAAALCGSVFDWMASRQLSYRPPLMNLDEMVRPAKTRSNAQASQTTYSRVPYGSNDEPLQEMTKKEPHTPTKVKLQLMLTNGIRYLDNSTIPDIVSNRFYNGDKYTPLFDSFILHEEHGASTLYFFQYSVSKYKDGYSGQGYHLVLQIYKKARAMMLKGPEEDVVLPNNRFVKRRRSSACRDLDVRFVLVQYRNEPRANWTVPRFDSDKRPLEDRFPFKVYYATLHLETTDPSFGEDLNQNISHSSTTEPVEIDQN